MIMLINLIYIKQEFIADKTISAGQGGYLLFGITLLATAIGFVIGTSLISTKMTDKQKAAYIDRTIMPKIRNLQNRIEKEAREEPKIEPWPSVEEIAYPGKYVASASGSSYHAPSCDWAKKISEENRVWFKAEADAQKKKYKK